ncbi:hypothetical protein ACPV5U_08665 [Vibrio mediterranei]
MTIDNFKHYETNIARIKDARLRAIGEFIYKHRNSFDYDMIAKFVNSNGEFEPIERNRVSNATHSLKTYYGFVIEHPKFKGDSYRLTAVKELPPGDPRYASHKAEENMPDFRAAFRLMGDGEL